MKDYIDNHFTGSNTDLLFPKFGEGRHASGDRSKKLSDFVDNQRSDDDLISPYSLRHTLKDKYQRAIVPKDIGNCIFAHKSDQSNQIHAKYGTGRGVEDLSDEMKAIVAVKEWGFLDDYDD